MRLTAGLRDEVVRLYREYDRTEVTPVVRQLSAVEGGRVDRDGAQVVALSPAERWALADVLDYASEERRWQRLRAGDPRWGGDARCLSPPTVSAAALSAASPRRATLSAHSAQSTLHSG